MQTLLSFTMGLYFGTIVLALLGYVHGTGDTWALLVAGSNTWWNYRHQADICHAYHVVRNAGVPENRIITMMFDDIANAKENPNKGTIINKPGGSDVYAGVKIDYKGGDLTPQNFLNILQGNKSAMAGIGTGRVIESDSSDNIFVNFADHGGVGILCFPSEYLYAKDLHAALTSMTKNKKYGKMVMYIEACEAGSMFDALLPENTNIFVSTASAPDESSWGWYCENPLNTCLGDFYSVTWMEHMDKLLSAGLTGSENLFHQYQLVRTAVNKSHVQIYGDFSLGYDSVALFIGNGQEHSYVNMSQNINIEIHIEDGVPSRDVPLHIVTNKLKNAKTELERMIAAEQLDEMKKKRMIAKKTVDSIVEKLTEGDEQRRKEVERRQYTLTNEGYNCYRNLVETFNKHCFNTHQNTYLVSFFYKFVNLCYLPWAPTDNVVAAMKTVCNKSQRMMNGII